MVSSISLVFWNFIVLWEDVALAAITSKNIFLNSVQLNRTTIAYKSQTYIWDFSFQSACKLSSKYLGDAKGLSYFEVIFLDDTCRNGSIYLKNSTKTFLNTEVKLNLLWENDLYKVLLDYSNATLEGAMEKYDKSSEKLSMYKDYSSKWAAPESFVFASKARQYQENVYKKDLIQSILERREYKYILPVVGSSLPTASSKVPNAGRPYRKDVTDGIHHSWDLNTSLWEKVVALDDAIVVRVVDSWSWSSLSNIRKDHPTEEDKMRNLDIYRGNQVWLKTMKGEVVMYAHLDKIVEGIKEWMVVTKWTPVATIGVTGVPQLDYDDVHLDFSVHENPYDKDMAGKYDIEDYMTWPWLLKGKDYDTIIERQYDFFEKSE